MDSSDLSVLRTCVQWLKAGRRVALATVVQTWGSSPRPPGAWLAIRDDGQVVGSVSGGCVEDDLIAWFVVAVACIRNVCSDLRLLHS